jgi:hypothetical protein
MMREIERRQTREANWIEVREERVGVRTRWSIRAAQWRALELAREVFGEEASAALDSFAPRGAFFGMVRLEVPFEDLASHQDREAQFSALAGADELLCAVPLVFVFDPSTVETRR